VQCEAGHTPALPLPALDFILIDDVHVPNSKCSVPLDRAWLKQTSAAHNISHVVQTPDATATDLTCLDLLHIGDHLNTDGLHVLLNVPLGQLRSTCKLLRSCAATAFVLIPSNPRFKTCSVGLSLCAEYSAAQIYQTTSPHSTSTQQLYSSTPSTEVRACSAVGSGLAMEFDVFLGTGKLPPSLPATALLDSGATHCFIESAYVQKLKLPVTPSTTQNIILADGSSSALLGTVDIVVCIQGVVTQVSAYCLASMPTYNLILGESWLIKNHAIINYDQISVTLVYPDRNFILYPRKGPGFKSAIAHAMSLPPLSHSVAEQLISDGSVAFCMHMELHETLESDIIALPPEDSELIWPTDLPPDVMRILHEHADVFGPVLPGLPPNESGPCIELIPGAVPPRMRPYRLTPKELDICHTKVKALLDLGHIVPCRSPFASPVHFVTKRSGETRMVFDLRRVNAITVKQHFPMARVDDIFDQLSGCSFFSSLDLTSAYNQLRLPEEEVERTAFVVPFGQFASRVLSFGLTNAAQAFTRVLTKLLGHLVGKFIAIYLDDILIFSKSAVEHADHIAQVLGLLRKAQFKAKLSKCFFCRSSLNYLGHVVGSSGLSVNPDKVSAVSTWPTPTNLKALLSFLGLANYFRRFICGYSSTAAPLTALTGNKTPWSWSPECQIAFEAIKSALTSAPVLVFPDFSLPFTVIADASLLGTGAVLLQQERPICYTSSKFSPAELNYTTTEQELLAVIRAFAEWRCYLEGAQHTVTIVTDHNPLTYLSTQNTLGRRQSRWSEFLQRFDHTWKYIPGHTNMADPLSRHPARTLAPSSVPLPGPPTCSVSLLAQTTPSIRDLLITAYADDPWFTKKTNLKHLQRDDQQLWRLNLPGKLPLIQVPHSDTVKLAILRELHDSPAAGHPGPQRTLCIVRRWFYWRGMARFIQNYASHCPSCQQMKPTSQKPAGLLEPLPVPAEPWSSISMDLLTCLPVTKDGYDTIVVWVDRLTKFCVAAPAKLTIDAPGFAALMVDAVISKFGLPDSIVSDRDVRFTGAFFKTLEVRLGTRLHTTTAFHPQGDGQSERMIRLLQESLRHFVCYTQNDWDKYLQLATFAINNADSQSTGQSPFYLNYGRHPRHPSGISDLPSALHLSPAALDFTSNLQQALKCAKGCLLSAQQRQKTAADHHRQEVIFKAGDLVLLSTKNLKLKAGQIWSRRKLLPKFIGPFEVLSTVTAAFSDNVTGKVPCAVKLLLPATTKIHPVFHVSLLTHWKDPVKDPLAKRVPQPLDWLHGEPQFLIKSLSGHKWLGSAKRPRLFFVVKWSGDCDDSLDSRVNLFASEPLLVTAYEQLHALAIAADKPAVSSAKAPKPLAPALTSAPVAVPAPEPPHPTQVVKTKAPAKAKPSPAVLLPLLPSKRGRERKHPAKLLS